MTGHASRKEDARHFAVPGDGGGDDVVCVERGGERETDQQGNKADAAMPACDGAVARISTYRAIAGSSRPASFSRRGIRSHTRTTPLLKRLFLSVHFGQV